LPESARGLLIYFRQRRIFTERLEDTDDIAIGSCRSRRRFEVAQRGRAEGRWPALEPCQASRSIRASSAVASSSANRLLFELARSRMRLPKTVPLIVQDPVDFRFTTFRGMPAF
jgi:hypothetical protein